jgi:hypothetical protein
MTIMGSVNNNPVWNVKGARCGGGGGRYSQTKYTDNIEMNVKDINCEVCTACIWLVMGTVSGTVWAE